MADLTDSTMYSQVMTLPPPAAGSTRHPSWDTENRRERQENTRFLAAKNFHHCRSQLMVPARYHLSSVEALTRIYKLIFKAERKPSNAGQCKFAINETKYQNGPFSGPAQSWLVLAHGFTRAEAIEVWKQFLKIDSSYSATLFLSASIMNKANGIYDPALWEE